MYRPIGILATSPEALTYRPLSLEELYEAMDDTMDFVYFPGWRDCNPQPAQKSNTEENA